ncbi:hypothetical protein N0V82_010390 [Gnomoniopsis sp. IMI 355080]|nr:hypothetical protein N0V82_010390 [Gnomoniopsis sp. IMI 355080]
MDPDQTDRLDDVDRPSRVLPGITSVSQTIRKTIITITEPLSPSRSEFEIESANSTPGFPEKLRRWSSHYKSADARSIRSSLQATKKEPRTLMTLPHELQIMVLSFLEFGDIERLRRASKYWYNFATPRLVRSIYGPDTFRAMLIQHCRVCLTYCPRDVTRIVTTRLDAGYPLSSRCIKCTVQSKDGTVRIGRKVTLGNFTDYWTCRWCGWPITNDPSTGHHQFHRSCYDKYAVVLLAFFCLGWVQFFIGVVAAALSWHYFPHNSTILAPTIVGFVLTWVCIILIMFRGNRVRTYHLALLIELAIVGLWIPPIYHIGKEIATRTLELAAKPAIAIIAFVGLNMLFRVINILGNIILISEYDRTKHYVPRIPIWRRFMNPILTALIFWTYPQHAERKFGPDWA